MFCDVHKIKGTLMTCCICTYPHIKTFPAASGVPCCPHSLQSPRVTIILASVTFITFSIKKVFIFLLGAALGLRCHVAVLQLQKVGGAPCCSVQASHCSGSPGVITGSGFTSFPSCGPRALECGLSCGAWAIFSRTRDQTQVPASSSGGFLSIVPTGKSNFPFLTLTNMILLSLDIFWLSQIHPHWGIYTSSCFLMLCGRPLYEYSIIYLPILLTDRYLDCFQFGSLCIKLF